jgi:hypothetical protein
MARSGPLVTVIPAVYLAAARLLREPHWDHHELRSDLSHIGTAVVEAGVVPSCTAAANSTWGI